jgi:antitoxin HigA-1
MGLAPLHRQLDGDADLTPGLARYFGNSARFRINLQTAYELAVAEAKLGERIAAEVAPAAA